MGPAPARRGARYDRSRNERGFTIIETLVVIVLGIIISALAMPFFFRIYKRQKLRSAVQEAYSIVLAARMQAVRRNMPVVVFFDLTNHQIKSWADIPRAASPPNNFTQDLDEPTITQWKIPDFLLFTDAPGGDVDNAHAVAFDQYNGNAALVDRIIFQADGSLVQPQAANSARPARPVYTATVKAGAINCAGSLCRGVFFSDLDKTLEPDRNVFRISVDDFGSTGKVSLLKWLPASYGGNGGEIDYVPGPWVWAN